MENELALAITTKGAEAASAKIKSVTENITGTGKASDGLSDKLKTAGAAIAAVGVGLTAYSKHATNSYVDYVKQTNSISRITGEAIDVTSRLQYVFQRSGIAADQSAQVFGIFQKQIVKTNEATAEQAQKQAELTNKIEAARIKIAAITKDTQLHGDATGANKNQVEALNIAIAGYQKQLGEGATALQKLGVETKDNEGKARSFSEVLLDVADKFKQLPNGAEKTALSMQLFGRQGKDLIPVLNKGRDGIKELQDQADKLGLTLSTKNVDSVMKYIEANKKLKDAQQQLTTAVGQEALPMWQKLADAQVWLTKKFGELPPGVKQATAAVLAFGGPVLTVSGSVLTFASDLGGAIDTVRMFAQSSKVAAIATKVQAAAQWLLNAAMSANPIALVVIAIAALVAGFLWAYNNIKPFRDFMNGLFKGFMDVVKVVWDWITQNWPTLLAILAGPVGLAVLLIVQHWETIKAAFAAAWEFIKSVWSGYWAFYAAIWNGIVTIFSSVVSFFAGVFSGAWNAVRSAFNGVTGFFAGLWNSIVNIFGSIGSAVGNAIGNAVRGAINGVISGAVGIINGFINSINGIVGIINKIPGVNLGRIGNLPVPRLAQGGIVPATPGGRLALIGEGGKDEAVIPLDKLDKMMNSGSTVNFYGNITLATKEASDAFFKRLNAQADLASMGVPT